MAGNGVPPDPVSEIFDTAAAYVLRRAYDQKGGWFGTVLVNPTPAQRARFIESHGIDVTGPDNAATISGKRKDCRSRWGRAFVRRVYYLNDARHGGPGRAIEIEIGARKPAVGRTPAGRSVRVRLRRGGSVALKAVQRKQHDDRIWTDEGDPAGRFSDISGRDWG